MAEQLFAQEPDWVTFYREILGCTASSATCSPPARSLAAFEQTDGLSRDPAMLTKLREQGPVAMEDEEPTRVITVRLPKSLHEALRVEAHEHRTSMNKLCISKLLQFIDGEKVPTRRRGDSSDRAAARHGIAPTKRFGADL